MKLHGDTTAVPTGRIEQSLRAAAAASGGAKPEEIDDILDTDEVAVPACGLATEITVGND